VKLIVAVVRPQQLEATQAALGEVEVFRLTVADVSLVLPDRLEPVPHVRLEVAVNEAFVEPTLQAIRQASIGGEQGTPTGMLYVLPLTDVVRVRTGERGPDAI